VKLVVFGPAAGSSSEDFQAAGWRPLLRELQRRGHRVIFFAHQAEAQNGPQAPEFVGYADWSSVRTEAVKHLAGSDAAIVTSGCKHVAEAARAVLASSARVRCFYDLDPTATLKLHRLRRHSQFLPEEGLQDFDVVLSCTGGRALAELRAQMGARHVVPFYGWVDPDACQQTGGAHEREPVDLSYLGPWTPDREKILDSLFLEPARLRTNLRFAAGGAYRPRRANVPLPQNVAFFPHVPLAERPAFYRASRLILAIANPAAAAMGYCPSNPMLEAAGCGVPVISDEWEGLDYFFEVGREILAARTTSHVLEALAIPGEQLALIGRAGRERVLLAHTAARRAVELEHILEAAISLPVEPAGAGGKKV
jgi:spore maturation protein CgeB